MDKNEKFVHIEVNSRILAVSDKAVRIGGSWFPKSQILSLCSEEGDTSITEVVEKNLKLVSIEVPEWFAHKNGHLIIEEGDSTHG